MLPNNQIIKDFLVSKLSIQKYMISRILTIGSFDPAKIVYFRIDSKLLHLRAFFLFDFMWLEHRHTTLSGEVVISPNFMRERHFWQVA